MSTHLRNFLLPATVTLLLAAALFMALPTPADAAVSSWQQSASVVPTSTTEFGGPAMRDSHAQLADTSANHVTFIIPWFQSNIHTTDLHRGWNTPTDESLIAAIGAAHARGLDVSLKIHVEVYDGQWRANINPGDRAGWYAAYGGVLNHYATLAQANSVEQLILGAELIKMASGNQHPGNTAAWQSMIAAVRSRYSGLVTYSANWGTSSFGTEKNFIGFWPQLDSIGIAAYFPVGYGCTHDPGAMAARWAEWNTSDIKWLSDTHGKPVIFTEVGYRSVNCSNTDPWDSGRGGFYDPTVQAAAYEALFSYWNGQPFMQGVHFWDWQAYPGAGGAGATNYTPQNKPAMDVMRTWFSSGGGPTPPAPPPPASSYTTGATTSGTSPVTISATVRPNSGALSGGIVDIEVYNTSGTKVHQRVFEGESIASGATKTYATGWTPTTPGTYSVKIGIFRSGWSGLLHWNDAAATITVDGGGGPAPPAPPPSGPSAIEIWWPTDTVTVSGTQPFKIMLTNMSVDSYIAYWSVDGGGRVLMPTNLTEYPHKEVLVDLSGWGWRGEGPYTVKFTTTRMDGSTIAERLISIFVAR
jgi:hypothetical protein